MLNVKQGGCEYQLLSLLIWLDKRIEPRFSDCEVDALTNIRVGTSQASLTPQASHQPLKDGLLGGQSWVYLSFINVGWLQRAHQGQWAIIKETNDSWTQLVYKSGFNNLMLKICNSATRCTVNSDNLFLPPFTTPTVIIKK